MTEDLDPGGEVSPNKGIAFCRANSVKIARSQTKREKRKSFLTVGKKNFTEKKHKRASSMVLNLNWVLISFEVYHTMHSPAMHQFFTAYPLKANIRETEHHLHLKAKIYVTFESSK